MHRSRKSCSATAHGAGIATAPPEWTAARAESLLRDLPDTALEIIRLTVEGGGWGDAKLLRGEDGASLRGRTGSITQAIKRGIKAGRFLDGLPTPVIGDRENRGRTPVRSAAAGRVILELQVNGTVESID